MASSEIAPIIVREEQAGITVAALLRTVLVGKSWSQVMRFIADRHVKINGNLCLDPARRIKVGEVIECLSKPVPRPKEATETGLRIRHLDEDVVVVEKPSGINTVRHPAEREWSDKRRALDPTLEDLTQGAIARELRRPRHTLSRLRIVHRIDKETSGLVVFARSVRAERELGRQFRVHSVIRRYLAVIPGYLPSQRIRSYLIPDRGDGRRGSTTQIGLGKEAVTHIAIREALRGYTLLECRLETGRTHQIRIHLAEQGHPICGERVYNRLPNGEEMIDRSAAPRLALHASELGFEHPTSGAQLHWEMPLPRDLSEFIDRLRRGEPRS